MEKYLDQFYRFRFPLLATADFLLLMSSAFVVDLLLQSPFAVSRLVIFSIVHAGISVGFLVLFGAYRITIRYLGVHALKVVVLANLPMIPAGIALAVLLSISPVGSFVALVAIFSMLFVIGYRVLIREVMFNDRISSAAPTIVYGAGDAGVQFFTAAMQGDVFNVVGFLDDNPKKISKIIYGRSVYSPEKIENLIKRYHVSLVVLAVPRATVVERRAILERLLKFSVRVVSVPSVKDMVARNRAITDIDEIEPEDLLGREVVPPDSKLLKENVVGKCVLITGAGGSIGSELARQIISLGPSKLILLDSSEHALFLIEQELCNHDQPKDILLPILGSVTDLESVQKIFSINSIDSVFHAAAYKHVPLVETNPFSSVVNNIIGTQIIANAAIEHGVGSFTLISTDKAVRPTNIMGATKRFAELVCQALAATQSGTKISMVRFGNVLGSSGSVIPTFKKQIAGGGPVTVTHPDITRYFMTIPEAAQLVLQASAMARGGEVFLLDMGKPVKILDLAERLIRLSGHNAIVDSDLDVPHAIQIRFTGLRSGEKLYEELLIGDRSSPTDHPRIWQAYENALGKEQLDDFLAKLNQAVERQNLELLKEILESAGIGYHVPSYSS